MLESELLPTEVLTAKRILFGSFPAGIEKTSLCTSLGEPDRVRVTIGNAADFLRSRSQSSLTRFVISSQVTRRPSSVSSASLPSRLK